MNNFCFFRYLSFLCLISLTGCQYHLGFGDLPNRYQTISVPYVVGDQEGELTAELIKQLTSSGAFQYRPSGGDLILKIELIDLSDENIGFRYDRNKKGEAKKTIIPNETRLTGLVEITLIDSATDKIVRGPTQIKASVEFDHNFYFINKVNTFSLGQLSDIDTAHEAAMHPLNQQLAEQITDFVINSW